MIRKMQIFFIDLFDELVKSRHSREGGNPWARNFLKRMDSRLRTSGMTVKKRAFYDVVLFDSLCFFMLSWA
jgi:hypothetical protein